MVSQSKIEKIFKFKEQLFTLTKVIKKLYFCQKLYFWRAWKRYFLFLE